ncbi:MAG: hypothetical protein ACRC2S_18585 [Waterburya sp.]
MNKTITLNLPEDVYNRANSIAQLISRDLADVLIEAISLSLSPTSPLGESDSSRTESIKSLSDSQVIALSELQMNPEQDSRLSQLLLKQQADTLSETERPELWTLMQIYQTLLVKKAAALREAVSRGLREPLES